MTKIASVSFNPPIEIFAIGLTPLLKWGCAIVLHNTKREQDHGVVFMATSTSDPLNAKRFSKNLIEAVRVACGVDGFGSQNLRRVLAVGSNALLCCLMPYLAYRCAQTKWRM